MEIFHHLLQKLLLQIDSLRSHLEPVYLTYAAFSLLQRNTIRRRLLPIACVAVLDYSTYLTGSIHLCFLIIWAFFFCFLPDQHFPSPSFEFINEKVFSLQDESNLFADAISWGGKNIIRSISDMAYMILLSLASCLFFLSSLSSFLQFSFHELVTIDFHRN